MKPRKPRKPRNPVAKALRTLRPIRVSDNRRKLRERSLDHDLDEAYHGRIINQQGEAQ